MMFLSYAKCTTCQKAKKWLDANEIEYEERTIKEQNPSIEELKAWHQMSGLLYKKMSLKDKLTIMSEEDQYVFLATDGMLVKRPMVIGDDFVLVGFKEADLEEKRK